MRLIIAMILLHWDNQTLLTEKNQKYEKDFLVRMWKAIYLPNKSKAVLKNGRSQAVRQGA